jgi:hypothetical protein
MRASRWNGRGVGCVHHEEAGAHSAGLGLTRGNDDAGKGTGPSDPGENALAIVQVKP